MTTLMRIFDLDYEIIKETEKQIRIGLNKALLIDVGVHGYTHWLVMTNLLSGSPHSDTDGVKQIKYIGSEVKLGKQVIYDPYEPGVEYIEDISLLRFHQNGLNPDVCWTFWVKELKTLLRNKISNELKTKKQIIFPKTEMNHNVQFPGTPPFITKYSNHLTGVDRYYNGFPQDFLSLNKKLFGGK